MGQKFSLVKLAGLFTQQGLFLLILLFLKPLRYIFKVVTMPPAAAQMMMKAVGFLLLVHICFQFVVSLFWRHQYTTEHVVTPGAPEPGKLSVAAILPAQMIGAFKPVYL